MPNKVHQTLELEYNADSVESCPWPGCCHLLAVGTYQLEESTQTRLGRLYLYSVQRDGTSHSMHLQSQDDVPGIFDLKWPHGIDGIDASEDVPGIFDLKWSHGNDDTDASVTSTSLGIDGIDAALCSTSGSELAPCDDKQSPESMPTSHRWLGAALADGSFRTYEVDAGGQLKEAAQCQGCSEGMLLSLDWSTLRQGMDEDVPAQNVSFPVFLSTVRGRDSFYVDTGASDHIHITGNACLLRDISPVAKPITIVTTGLAQLSYGAIYKLVSSNQHDVIYSGADDCYFKAWDMRQDDESPSACFNDRRTHSAGVCTISPHPTCGQLVATGSYDEKVRLWDVRMPTKPLCTSEPPQPAPVIHAGPHAGGERSTAFSTSRPASPGVTPAPPGANHMRRPSGTTLAGPSPPGTRAPGLGSDNVSPVISIVDEYSQGKDNNSIAYGADWVHGTCRDASEGCWLKDGADGGAEESLVATASFYDKQLHLWMPTLSG
eukprot:gene22758-29926_t